jgi:hypothetical protein
VSISVDVGNVDDQEMDNETLASYLIPTSPFAVDRDGEYGCHQNSAYFLFEKYLSCKNQNNNTEEGVAFQGYIPQPNEVEQRQIDAIIHLFNEKGITDENIMLAVLDYAKNQGCGQAVITNWICEKYTDNPEEFEEKFGYPLFTEKGYYYNDYLTYNYPVVLTDVFLSTNDQFLQDNIVDGNFIPFNDDSSVHADEMGIKYAMAIGENVEYIQVVHDVSVETYQRYIAEGYDAACIAAYRYDLEPYGDDNSYLPTFHSNRDSEDGHWMTITGVSENGNLIVSSWGDEWELTHSDIYAKFPVDGVQQEDRDDACIIFIKK